MVIGCHGVDMMVVVIGCHGVDMMVVIGCHTC